MSVLRDQLESTFGISVKTNDCEIPSGIPFYMSNGRSFQTVTISDITFLVVGIENTNQFGVIALEKQLARYAAVVNMPVAFLFSVLNKKQRDSLVARNIPFLCFPDQLYLPFLGMALSNRFIKQVNIATNQMSPSAQVLFLYFLYRAGSRKIIKKEAAEALHMTQMSVSRASEQLLAMSLITQESFGKAVQMQAVATGKELYMLAEDYLINPVHRALTVEKSDLLSNYPVAGETALSLHSMLSQPAIPVVAIGKGDSVLSSLAPVDEQWDVGRNVTRVEVWKYDPAIFSAEQTVDPVSLAASLKGSSDERIQGELEDYLEGLKW